MTLKFRPVPDPEMSYHPRGNCTSPRLLVWVDFNVGPDQPAGPCSCDGYELYPDPEGEYPDDFRQLAVQIASGDLVKGQPGEIYLLELYTREAYNWSKRKVTLDELV